MTEKGTLVQLLINALLYRHTGWSESRQ